MGCTPVIPALKRQRKEGHEFKAILGYTEKPYLKVCVSVCVHAHTLENPSTEIINTHY